MASSRADDLAPRLRSAPLEIVGRFGAASNATLLVRLRDRDPPPLPDPLEVGELAGEGLAVYKPERGEAPLWDFPAGTLHRREVAAYAVSAALDWGLVPVTVRRGDGPHGPGSVQRFVPHDPEQHYFRLLEEGGRAIRAQLRRVAVFDLVIDNADRKGGHVLLERGTRRIRAIDHGVTFHAERKLRTVMWDFAGEDVDAALRREVGGLADELDADLGDRLGGLLSSTEIEALRRRAETVAGLASFPFPEGPRPYPWPLL